MTEAAADDTRKIGLLVDNHRAFLRFLERRLGGRDVAEDVLQDAFVRSLHRLDEVSDEALVPWFYRVLRNAAIDRLRRRDVAARTLEAFAREASAEVPPDAWKDEICACVGRLSATLKPEYADALQSIDVDGVPVKAFAADRGLSASAAGVRVFRARQALKRKVTESCGSCAEHGCFNCSCGQPRS